jgi:valyl-tRNA synthetase
VLDTWFSSALWPFSTLGWPDDTKDVERYYPTDVLVTGFDIIFFWVARMMMMGLHFMKEAPFSTVYIHRLVRDEKGAKMSKSRGNVVDPLGVIDQYGADALRFTLARAAAQGHDIKLGPQHVEVNRNFATKLWNAARFLEFNGASRLRGFDPRKVQEPLNRWIVHETAKAAHEVTEALNAYRFNEAAEAAYRFVLNVYCDWYVELSKPILTGADGSAKSETRAAASWTLDEILKLLHPFMPFITEELWRVTAEQGPRRDTLLALAPWPNLSNLKDVLLPGQPSMDVVLDTVSEARSIRTTYNIQPKEPLTINLTSFSAANTSVLVSSASSIARLANTVVQVDGTTLATPSRSTFAISTTLPSAGTSISTSTTSTNPELTSPSGTFVIQTSIRDGAAFISMPGSFDANAERSRLDKEVAKADADIKRVDAKLANEKFVAKAPEELIEEEKEKREAAIVRKAKFLEAQERLKNTT